MNTIYRLCPGYQMYIYTCIVGEDKEEKEEWNKNPLVCLKYHGILFTNNLKCQHFKWEIS